MQLISFATLAFISAAAIVTATPIPVNPGDVHMAKPQDFVPPHTGGGAHIPHPVVAVTGHDSTGHVHVVQGSHNLPPDMKKYSKPANNYVGNSRGNFKDKLHRASRVATAFGMAHPQKIHVSDLKPVKPPLPKHLSTQDTHKLKHDAAKAVIQKQTDQNRQKFKAAAHAAAAAAQLRNAKHGH